MTQLEWVYDQLQRLRARTLVQIIDELDLIKDLPNDTYREMSLDIYNRAKYDLPVSHKQKRVLVNIIGQPRRN